MAVVKWLLHRDEQGRLKVEQNRITYDSKTSPEQSKVIADVWANEGVKITCISVWNHLREWGGGCTVMIYLSPGARILFQLEMALYSSI